MFFISGCIVSSVSEFVELIKGNKKEKTKKAIIVKNAALCT